MILNVFIKYLDHSETSDSQLHVLSETIYCVSFLEHLKDTLKLNLGIQFVN
jgi:hypothetical protein